MATETTLSDSWQKIADGGKASVISFVSTGEIIVDDGVVAPDAESEIGHSLFDGNRYAYSGANNTYARLADAADTGTATTTEVEYGGLTGLTGLAFVNISVVTG